MPPAAQSAQLGITNGIARLDSDAQVVAQQLIGSGGDITAALIDSLQQKLSVEASAAVLRESDQTLGSLIDVMA